MVVGGSWILEESKRLLKRLRDVLGVETSGLLPPFEVSAFSLDTGLLEGQHILVDQALVAQMQEVLLLAFEDFEFAGGTFGLGLRGLELHIAVAAYGLPNSVALVWRQPGVRAVVLLDLGLDEIDGDVGRFTVAVSSIEFAVALEVFVGAAAAFDAAVDHPAATFAEDRAAEVVLIFSRAVAAQAVGIEQVLYAVEGLLVNQLGMLALRVFGAIEGDHADVIVVSE